MVPHAGATRTLALCLRASGGPCSNEASSARSDLRCGLIGLRLRRAGLCALAGPSSAHRGRQSGAVTSLRESRPGSTNELVAARGTRGSSGGFEAGAESVCKSLGVGLDRWPCQDVDFRRAENSGGCGARTLSRRTAVGRPVNFFEVIEKLPSFLEEKR